MNGQPHLSPRLAQRSLALALGGSLRACRACGPGGHLRNRKRQGQLRLDDLVRPAMADVGDELFHHRQRQRRLRTDQRQAGRGGQRSWIRRHVRPRLQLPAIGQRQPQLQEAPTRLVRRSRATHELALQFDDGWSALAASRGSTTLGADNTERTPLSDDAKNIAVAQHHAARSWVSKDLELGDRPAKVNVGNQVLSWGEDIFIYGGINIINADRPDAGAQGGGTAQGNLPAGADGLVQLSGRPTTCRSRASGRRSWNAFRFDPVGTYFSVADVVGKGQQNGVRPELGAGRAAGNRRRHRHDQQRRVHPGRSALHLQRPAGAGHGRARAGDAEAARTRTSSASRCATRRTTPKPSGGSTTCTTTTRSRSSASSTIPPSPTTRSASATSCSTARTGTCSVCRSTATSATGRWAPSLSTVRRTASASTPRCRSRDRTARSAAPGTYPGYVDEQKWQAHLTTIYLLGPSGDLGWLLRGLGAAEGTLLAEAAATYYPKLDLSGKYPYLLPNYELPTKTVDRPRLRARRRLPAFHGHRGQRHPADRHRLRHQRHQPEHDPFCQGSPRRHPVAQFRVSEQVAGAACLHEFLRRRRQQSDAGPRLHLAQRLVCVLAMDSDGGRAPAPCGRRARTEAQVLMPPGFVARLESALRAPRQDARRAGPADRS